MQLPSMDEDTVGRTIPGFFSGRFERVVERVFLRTDRMLLAGTLLVVAFSVFVGLELFAGLSDSGRDSLLYLFSSLTGGNFTLITIIVSINQLVVSRQLGTPGELREQIEETNEYRESVVQRVPEDRVAPVTPSEFLHLLLSATRTAIDQLEGEAETVSDDEARQQLEELVADLTEHVDHVDSLLQESDASVFGALAATLTTNYSQQIYRARRLQKDYEGILSEEDNEVLDELVLLLQQVDVARQYLKTLYMQSELSLLSRRLLYVGVPAVFASIAMLQLFTTLSGTTIGPATVSTLTPLAMTVSLAPLAVVFSFVLRISAVAQRTVAITPFTTASQEL